MKPLLVTALYPPAVGGAATYFRTIVGALGRSGQVEAVSVLTERMRGEPRTASVGKMHLMRWLPNRLSAGPRSFPAHALTFVLTQQWFALNLARLVRQHQIDLVHFHTRYRGRLFYAALKRAGVPVIADLRDKMTNPAQLRHVADRLLCCGEGVLRFAVAAGYPAERAVLLPNAFDPPDVPSADRVSDVRRRYGIGGGPYLFFAGDITYNKGVYDLLRAYGRWRPGDPLVRLVLAGSNREGKRFLDQVPHDGSVVYTGHVPHSDVLAMMRGAEVVVLPSRSEGLPTVILEAIALGTKVICPPGIPEFERHLAQFVLPRVDEGAIVDALNAAWHSGVVPSYPLSEHSVSRVVEALVEVYDQVLRERSVPAPASGGWHADRSG